MNVNPFSYLIEKLKNYTADKIPFDNTGTSISSSNVQGAIKEIDSDLTGYTTLTGNPAYFGLSSNTLFYKKIGNIVIGSARFTITTEKPAGQANYLFSDLPIPRSYIAPVLDSYGVTGIIINTSGYLTSNATMATGSYNISFSYIAD